MSSRRGFTLIELMVALVLLSIVAAVTFQLLINTQRLSRAQSERVALQSNVRTGSLVMPSELRELANGSADISEMGANAISYRAMRGLGVVCQFAANEIRIENWNYSGVRTPVAGRDSMLLFVESTTGSSADDAWLPLAVTSVSSGMCGGEVVTVIGTNGVPTGNMVVYGPVRFFETMRLNLHSAGGRNWLGAESRSGGGGVQPVLGPLAANGFALRYLDDAGNATANANEVRSIEVTLRGETAQPIANALGQTPALATDSLVTLVTLRNAP